MLAGSIQKSIPIGPVQRKKYSKHAAFQIETDDQVGCFPERTDITLNKDYDSLLKKPSSAARVKRARSGKCAFCLSRKASNKQLYQCSEKDCVIEFHLECISIYGKNGFRFQYFATEHLGSHFKCPMHYCEAHMENNKLHSAICAPNERMIECMKCLRAWHRRCIPATAQILKDVNEKEWVLCEQHLSPRKAGKLDENDDKSLHLPFCMDCCSTRNTSENPLISCKTCIRKIHKKCEPLKLEKKTKDFQCRKCSHKASARLNRVVHFREDDRLLLGITRAWDDSKSPNKTRKAGEMLIEKLVRKKTAKLFFVKTLSDVVEFQKHRFEAYESAAKLNKKLQDPRRVKEVILEFTEKDKKNKIRRPTPKFQNIEDNDWGKIEKPVVKLKYRCGCDPEEGCMDCKLRAEYVFCGKDCAAQKLFGHCSNQMSSIRENDTEIRDTGTMKGKGLFAKKPFFKDEVICRFIGEIIEIDEYDRRHVINSLAEDDEEAVYYITLTKNLLVEPFFKGNCGRFSNHSHGANAQFKQIFIPNNGSSTEHIPDMAIVALKNIKPGEEITVNYGPDYVLPERCACGDSKCISPWSEWGDVKPQELLNLKKEDMLSFKYHQRMRAKIMLKRAVTVDEEISRKRKRTPS